MRKNYHYKTGIGGLKLKARRVIADIIAQGNGICLIADIFLARICQGET
jgi:hypothetical protein